MIRDLIYGMIGNFVFSTCIFYYKRHYNNKYDEIIRRLDVIENLLYLREEELRIRKSYFVKE